MSHRMIKLKLLRTMYAKELLDLRRGVPLRARQDAYWMGVRFGLETVFYRMQELMDGRL